MRAYKTFEGSQHVEGSLAGIGISRTFWGLQRDMKRDGNEEKNIVLGVGTRAGPLNVIRPQEDSKAWATEAETTATKQDSEGLKLAQKQRQKKTKKTESPKEHSKPL